VQKWRWKKFQKHQKNFEWKNQHNIETIAFEVNIQLITQTNRPLFDCSRWLKNVKLAVFQDWHKLTKQRTKVTIFIKNSFTVKNNHLFLYQVNIHNSASDTQFYCQETVSSLDRPNQNVCLCTIANVLISYFYCKQKLEKSNTRPKRLESIRTILLTNNKDLLHKSLEYRYWITKPRLLNSLFV
jgi:hypothetical protein